MTLALSYDEKITSYMLKRNCFGHYVLMVKVEQSYCDTNTGLTDKTNVTTRKATEDDLKNKKMLVAGLKIINLKELS